MEEADLRDFTDADLERMALGTYVTPAEFGLAKAELDRRRRAHEAARDELRWKHDVELMDVQGRYNAVQQDHESALAREQMAHAEKLTDRQVAAAVDSARATKFAAWSAAFSAAGAIVAAVVALLQYFGSK